MTRFRIKLAYLYKIAALAVLIPSLSLALNWDIQVVESDTGQIYGAGLDMAVDVNNIVHVVYFDDDDLNGSSSLIHASSNGSPWNYSAVEYDCLDLEDHKTVMAVDANGVVYVVYPDNEQNLVYRKKDNDQWNWNFIDFPQSLPGDAEISEQGRLNVVYTVTDEIDPEDVSLMLYAGGDSDEIENHAGIQSASIALGAGEIAHISYYYDDDVNQLLKYAVKDDNSLTVEIVDSVGDIPSYVWGSTSLALDGDGIPHISYIDFANGDLKYADRLSGGWTAHTVDDTVNVGQQTSIAVDSNDRIRICYKHLVAGRIFLKYAVGTAAGGWQFDDTITDFNQTGSPLYLSLACDANDNSHVCYNAPVLETVEYAFEPICGNPDHPFPSGDADKNCLVDFFDLGLLGRYWLDTGCALPDYCNGADLDKSTIVDNNDLYLLAETWMNCSLTDCY